VNGEPQETVKVYVGKADPYVFNWGGVEFQVHRGDPPYNHPRVDPPGPPMSQAQLASAPGSRLIIYPEEDGYQFPAQPPPGIPETMGVMADFDDIQYRIGNLLTDANRPYRIRVEAALQSSNWSELRPLLESMQGVIDDETEVFLVGGGSESVHG
jgi:hypothetical protein